MQVWDDSPGETVPGTAISHGRDHQSAEEGKRNCHKTGQADRESSTRLHSQDQSKISSIVTSFSCFFLICFFLTCLFYLTSNLLSCFHICLSFSSLICSPSSILPIFLLSFSTNNCFSPCSYRWIVSCSVSFCFKVCVSVPLSLCLSVCECLSLCCILS